MTQPVLPGERAMKLGNRRRTLLIAAGIGALTAALPSLAQQKGKVWRIGYLDGGSRQLALESRIPAFLQGMKELGYVEGKHFVLELRFADGNNERLSALAGELVQLNADVIVTQGVAASHAAQRTTSTIPIVVAVTPDPVRDGLAMSLAKPSGNITGMSSGTAEVIQKHVELLATAVPRITRIAILLHPANPGHPALVLSVQVAAQRTGRQVLPVAAGSPEEIERGFASMTRNGADAVIVLVDSMFRQQRRQIAGLALKHRLPSSYANLEYADAGGLIVYAANVNENFRRAAIFVDKILKGAKPGELPFELPTRFQLVINRKTANALGLTIPQELLLRAERVIE
jgi:putative ABC transport system substrate-binding protein